ncbi:kinase-like domain-containing protein, partial [Cantharellus anzutake]|uniref:kinase-like domain-containing protein n=1 Tax=Cantharellus anzutake TaxID=1750568 RepID=UPI0019052B2E
KLGEYIVIRSLGEGTFGKVKLAVHTLSGQKVALKHINKGSINAYKVRTRVKREIEYLKLLKHPHIIKLYEVIDTPREVIMVMEYAGGELFNYIVDNGRLSESAARKFFQQIAYCLAYSHAHRIVHRDIKPENVLLDENLNVKLADFGLSNEITDGNWLSTSCGSPNYAAPEVISGQLYAGPEIDVWSLGVILYVMVCGRLPFEDEHVPTLFQKISAGLFHKPSHLSPEVAHLIEKMLQTNPLKRFTIPDVLSHPWVAKDTPLYLREIYAQQPLAHSTIDSLTSLLTPPNAGDDDPPADFYPGIGKKLDMRVFGELQAALGVEPAIISSALAAFEDNCVKVAYQLFADRKVGRTLDPIQEQDDSNPSASSSARPIAIPPSRVSNRGPGDYGSPPHPAEDETEDDEDDDGFDETINWNSAHDIRLLDTSMVGAALADHHLASYANMRNASKGRASKWHFGIRSSSPPMEVMLELYRTLEVLGLEWREKQGDDGGRGGAGAGRSKSLPDDSNASDSYDQQTKDDMDIYFIECRWRVRNVVLIFDLQLYQVDSMNYLVDFRDLGYYRARSTDPDGPDGYEPADRPDIPRDEKNGDFQNPLIFLECACRLILELAGGSG